jgi:hypothetical protein
MDLRSGGRRLPCSVLVEWLAIGRPVQLKTPAQRRALLLAALDRNLLTALAQDLGLGADDLSGVVRAPLVDVPSRGIARVKLDPRAVPVRQLELPWRLTPPILMAQSYALLARLPIAWAEQAVAWAPPVVLQDAKTGRWVVAAHLASAWVARGRLLDTNISVQVATEHHGTIRPTHELNEVRELVRVVLPPLMGLCHGFKQQIADFSDGLLSGQWEDQLRRAMTYRYRQRARSQREVAAQAVKTPNAQSLSGRQNVFGVSDADSRLAVPNASLSAEEGIDVSTDE